MTVTDFFYLLFPIIPSVFLGYVFGRTGGEKAGYELGYHEGSFDERTGGAR